MLRTTPASGEHDISHYHRRLGVPYQAEARQRVDNLNHPSWVLVIHPLFSRMSYSPIPTQSLPSTGLSNNATLNYDECFLEDRVHVIIGGIFPESQADLEPTAWTGQRHAGKAIQLLLTSISPDEPNSPVDSLPYSTINTRRTFHQMHSRTGRRLAVGLAAARTSTTHKSG